MVETISLDTKTLIVKSDDEADISDIINFVMRRKKSADIAAFLQFAAQNRVTDTHFTFNREDCYDR